jgi:hypothetical protein
MRLYLMAGVLLLSLCYTFSPVFARPVQNDCLIIGRAIEKKGNRLVAGSPICDGDPIRSILKRGQQFICFLDDLGLTAWNDKRQCSLRPNQRDRLGGKGNLIRPVPKGSGVESDTPTIIRPLGTALLRSPKVFSWYAVPGASSYSVEVAGSEFTWERKVSDTLLEYPKNAPAMNSGNSYKVTIFAYRGSTPIKSSSKPYSMFSADRIVAVAKKITIASEYLLSDDERAYSDLNSIYLSQGLEEEAVSVLENRIKSGSSDPNVFGLLSTQFANEGHSALAVKIMNQLQDLKTSQ